MIPFQSILTPLFLILTSLGLQNTLLGPTLVYMTLQLPFAIFMMRNTFDAVPQEIEDAARIDGAASTARSRGDAAARPAGLIATALFSFLTSWNEFFAALILMSDESSTRCRS